MFIGIYQQTLYSEQKLDKDAAVIGKIKPERRKINDRIEEEQKIVKSLFLLTTKPILYVANVSYRADANHYCNFAAEENAEVIVVSAQLMKKTKNF